MCVRVCACVCKLYVFDGSRSVEKVDSILEYFILSYGHSPAGKKPKKKFLSLVKFLAISRVDIVTKYILYSIRLVVFIHTLYSVFFQRSAL